MKISYRKLKNAGACEGGMALYVETFGKKTVLVKRKNIKKYASAISKSGIHNEQRRGEVGYGIYWALLGCKKYDLADEFNGSDPWAITPIRSQMDVLFKLIPEEV